MRFTKPSYYQFRAEAFETFNEAAERRKYTLLQSFAFTYEHFEILIDGDDCWQRLISLTAVFKVAVESGVKLLEDSMFTDDVLSALKSCYLDEAPLELSKHEASSELSDLRADMELISAKFL